MDIGDFNQSEAWISLCSRFALHDQYQMFTFVHKKKGPGDKGDQISGPPVY